MPHLSSVCIFTESAAPRPIQSIGQNVRRMLCHGMQFFSKVFFRHPLVRFCPFLSFSFRSFLLLSVSVRFCPFLFVSIRLCPLLSVSVRFFPFLSVSVRFCLVLSISVNFCPFMSVSVRFCLFLSVSVRFCQFLSVSVPLGIFLVSVLLSAHVERCSVSRMMDFLSNCQKIKSANLKSRFDLDVSPSVLFLLSLLVNCSDETELKESLTS